MTPQQRLERFRDTIDRIQEDIEWLRESRFRIPAGGSIQPGWEAPELIEQLKRHIALYEHFIDALEAQQ
jgi:hypothetical protein